MYLFCTLYVGSWYKGNLKARVDEAMDPENGETLPQSDAYTINGQPGDLLPCSNGMFFNVRIYIYID